MSNIVAPAGAVVRLYVDLDRRVKVGDVIETRTGRAYRVFDVRVQKRGKHEGRQRLRCIVLADTWLADLTMGDHPAPASTRIHRIRWYRRRGGASVRSG